MTKQFLFSLLTVALLISCSKNQQNEMLVQGEIKGLKKGTLFLQKIQDGVLSTVDSLIIKGDGNYELSSIVESAELYFLSLNKSNEKTIPFFGEAGIITINTNLNYFVFQAKISGSKNQEILDIYNKMSDKFKNQNLDMIKENFDAQIAKNQEKLDALAKKSKQQIKREYLYTTNFAINNADSEVAPYLALTKLSNANIMLLDTINKSLSEKIKNSTYGKELNAYVEQIKKSEK
jgi:hypothetical protein